MTDTTDIAAIPKMTLEDLLIRCTDYDDMSLSMDASELKMLKQHISLLEAERQRADENQSRSNTFKSIIGYIKDANRNETFELWKETSDRLNADGCSGTASHVIEYLEELNKAFESEAELAALRGTQDPAAYLITDTELNHVAAVAHAPSVNYYRGKAGFVVTPLFTPPA